MSVYYIELGKEDDFLIRKENKKVILNKTNNIERDIKLPKWSDDANIKKVDNIKNLPKLPIAIHTGKSNLIIVDFDDKTFYEAIELNESLDDKNKCKFISSSVGKVGGHFIYKYQDNILTKFINNPNGKKQNAIDTLYGNTIAYHSNENNLTKSVLINEDDLNFIPLAMQYFLISKYTKDNIKTIDNQINVVLQGTKLATLAQKALLDDSSMEIFLSIITPTRYKNILAQSHKPLFKNHPDRLPQDESAHLYLVSLSCILMLDYSIDSKLHEDIMLKINNMFSEPLDFKRLKTIIDRDIHSDKFNYDSNWQQKSLIILNTNNEPLEIFMFNNNGTLNYIVYNQFNYSLTNFASASAVIDYIASVARHKLVKDKLTKLSTYVNIVNDPSKPFGFNYKENYFNLYKWNKEQSAFYNPVDYYDTWTEEEKNLVYNEYHPRYPLVTLKALKNSVGDLLYTHFLPFMRRKYDLREHSSLFFVLYGVPHSFKSALVNGVFSKLSEYRYKLISLEVLIDKYNDWMLNTDLVLIDEAHYFLDYDLKKLIKQINEITGNSKIAGIRRMHQSLDSISYKNEITFFLTTNEPIKITNEIQDRRMVVFKSMQKVSTALNMSNEAIRNAIVKESVDFAYFLSTQVHNIDYNDYVNNQNWKNETYEDFQDNALKYEDKIAKAIDSKDVNSFINTCLELNLTDDDIVNSLSVYSNTYYVRLIDTNPSKSLGKALFSSNLSNLDIKYLSKRLQNVGNVSYNIQENLNGVYNGNKKTSAKFDDIPDFLKIKFNAKKDKELQELKKESIEL